MATDLTGLLNRAINYFTPEKEAILPDFKTLEKAVFANDGLVTASESIDLTLLNQSPIPVLLSEDDQKRLKAMTHDGGFTLNRYYALLAKEGLEPANPKEELDAIALSSVQDYVYDFQGLNVNKSENKVELTFISPEKQKHFVSFPLDLPTRDEDWASLSVDILPLTFNDILTGLSRHLAKPLREKERQAIELLFQAWLETNIPFNPKKSRQSGSTAQTEISSAQWIATLLNLPKGSPLFSIDTNFYGDRPTKEQTEALSKGWEKIPQEIRTLIKNAGYDIQLVSDKTLKRLADENSQITMSPMFGGYSSTFNHTIYIFNDQDLVHLTALVVHECGHALHEILSSKKGGKNFQGSAFDEVLLHHYASVTRGEHYENAPTVYGSTLPIEWFAEMFTLWIFAEDHDVGSSISEYGLGWDYLAARAKQRDTLGFMLVDAVLEAAITGQSPECRLNWRDYPTIRDFIQEGQMPIAEVYMDTSLQVLPCDPNDPAYRAMQQMTDPAARRSETRRLFNTDKQYYLFKRDAYARVLLGFVLPNDPSVLHVNFPKMDDAFNWFEWAITESPDDPVLQYTLLTILNQPVKPVVGDKWGGLSPVPDIEARLMQLANTMATAYPEWPNAKQLRGYVLAHRGDYAGALKSLGEMKEILLKQKGQMDVLKNAAKANNKDFDKSISALDQQIKFIQAQEAEMLALQGENQKPSIFTQHLLKNDQVKP